MTLVTLVPVGPKDGWYPYALDIRSRTELLNTFATFMAAPKSQVEIDADPVRGVLTFTSTWDTATAAPDAIALALALADTTLYSSTSTSSICWRPSAARSSCPRKIRCIWPRGSRVVPDSELCSWPVCCFLRPFRGGACKDDLAISSDAGVGVGLTAAQCRLKCRPITMVGWLRRHRRREGSDG